MNVVHRGIEIARLPFYWRLKPAGEKTGNIAPEYFPFGFDFDERNGLLIERRDAKVLAALEVVYQQEYNIGYLQDANEIARPYGKDFIDYLEKNLTANPGIGSVLEVGCGGCVVLAELQDRGYKVTGIDSSPFAAAEGKKKGVPVVTGLFPSRELEDKFDLVFHVDVLEHIEDPIGFLGHIYRQLNDDGIVVVNVPDATESIRIGDISMAMHQHLNYFDEDSLRCTLHLAGFDVVSVDRAGYGGSLYAVGRRTKGGQSGKAPAPSGRDVFEQFVDSASSVVERFGTLSRQVLSGPDNRLGYYVPLRTLPYISFHELWSGFRFFDDTGHWHLQQFDGVDIAIENFEDLRADPVTHIIVMSLTFGDVIKRKIESEFGESIEVCTLKEIVDSSRQ